jgi:hypothetical protein
MTEYPLGLVLLTFRRKRFTAHVCCVQREDHYRYIQYAQSQKKILFATDLIFVRETKHIYSSHKNRSENHEK